LEIRANLRASLKVLATFGVNMHPLRLRSHA
jgi:hypothetical protein